MRESDYFFKKIKGTTNLIIGICLLVVAILLELYVVFDYQKESKSSIKYEDANTFGQYVYIDVKDYTDAFATYKSDDKNQSFYFVKDDQYIYVAAIKPKTLKELPGRIYGYTTTFPEELIKIAIDSANNEKVTNETFYNYFGMYYVDAYRSPIDDLIGFSIILGIVVIIAFVLIITYLSKNKHNNKVLASYGVERIRQEIDDSTTVANHLGKTYLTTKSIISFCNKLLIINLSDILWIYPHVLRYNGRDFNSLIATNKNGKAMTITMYSASSKKAKQSFDEFYQSIMTRNRNILYGYTAENIEKVDNIIKGI